MGILTHWRIMGCAAALVIVGFAAARVHAASSRATAQVIIIMPPRSTPTDANGPAAPDAFPAGLPASMERTTTVLRDGDMVTILHTATEPL
jgi:hypothetical protein